MIVRDAETRDFDRLDEIYEQVDKLHRDAHPERFRKPVVTGRSSEYFETALEVPGAFLLVAENDGVVIGFAEAYTKYAADYPIFQPRKWMLIDGIAVDKSYRRTGAGQALFDELIRRAKISDTHQIELNVYEFNEPAYNFYKKNGFETICKTMGKKIKPI